MKKPVWIFLVCTACAMFSKAKQENLSQVRVGETPAELTETLGDPDSKIVDGNQERWEYEIATSDNRGEDPYTGVFEKGVLTRWYFDTARASGHSSSGKGRRGSKSGNPNP